MVILFSLADHSNDSITPKCCTLSSRGVKPGFHEIDLQRPRSWAERAYPKLIHYNKLEKGGHFAAWEQPQLLSQEICGFQVASGEGSSLM
jgi:hypothetical protein